MPDEINALPFKDATLGFRACGFCGQARGGSSPGARIQLIGGFELVGKLCDASSQKGWKEGCSSNHVIEGGPVSCVAPPKRLNLCDGSRVQFLATFLGVMLDLTRLYFTG